MAIDPTYDDPSSEELNFDNEESSSDLSNDIAEFELNSGSNVGKNSKASYKRNLLAKKRIEQLQEERELKKFEEDYFGDWD